MFKLDKKSEADDIQGGAAGLIALAGGYVIVVAYMMSGNPIMTPLAKSIILMFCECLSSPDVVRQRCD